MQYSDDITFDDNSYIIILTPGASLIVLGQNNQKVHYIGYALPVKYYNEYSKYEPFASSTLIYSKYLEEYINDLILSGKKIYIAYSQENNYELFLKSLEEINSKRKNKRQISKTKQLNFKYLGIEWWDIKVSEYN